jgi:hypothetical protein
MLFVCSIDRCIAFQMLPRQVARHNTKWRALQDSSQIIRGRETAQKAPCKLVRNGSSFVFEAHGPTNFGDICLPFSLLDITHE